MNGINDVNIQNLAVTQGDIAVSETLSLCLPMVCSTGSPNVFVNNRPVFTNTDLLTPSSPLTPYVLPETQRYMVLEYFTVSGGVTSIETMPNVPTFPPTVFTWFLRTIPSTIPGFCSKSVFINKKPAMRQGDKILPFTYSFVPTQYNVYFGN